MSIKITTDDKKRNAPANYEWSHRRIISETFPEGEMPEWMTVSMPAQIFYKASIRTVADGLSMLEGFKRDLSLYNKLRIKPNKTNEEKGLMSKIEKDILSPEGLASGMFNSFVTHYNNMMPSIDGKRTDQGIQVATAVAGVGMRKKKQGIFSRLLGRKPDTEMVPTMQSVEGE